MSLHFWMGLGAAQKGAQANTPRSAKHRQQAISIVVGALLALVAVFGLVALLFTQY